MGDRELTKAAFLPLGLLLSLTLMGCNFARTSTVVEPPPTPTTVRMVQVTAVPTVNRQPRAVSIAEAASSADASTAARTAEPPVSRCDTDATTPMTRHTVSATLAFREQRIAVQQRIQYINRDDVPLDQIVLNIEPNRLPNVFFLEALRLADGAELAAELTGRRLEIDLPEPLPPGCLIALDLDFRVQIPQIAAGLNGYTGYFGFGARQINLAHWLPMVAVRFGDTWLLNADPASVGEQTVAAPADWNVTLTVNGAGESLQVAAPGTVTAMGAGTWQIIQLNARDFALSLSERFQLTTQTTRNGVVVELYHFDDVVVQTEAGPVDSAAHTLDVAVHSLETYSDLFGPYPDPRFVVVQGDFPDGMEFSNLVFVSTDWFRTYAGQPTSYLTIITVHEVAHQWWYVRVGNDQAQHPWLDETLATYSEYIFYEEHYPELRDWWWRFRVNTFIPEGFADRDVDSTVYEFTSIREYINAVYLRGARMLHDLRGDLGTEAFFDWLNAYAEAGDGDIATPDLLWSLLTPEQLERTRETREQYLGAAAADAAATEAAE